MITKRTEEETAPKISNATTEAITAQLAIYGSCTLTLDSSTGKINIVPFEELEEFMKHVKSNDH